MSSTRDIALSLQMPPWLVMCGLEAMWLSGTALLLGEISIASRICLFTQSGKKHQYRQQLCSSHRSYISYWSRRRVDYQRRCRYSKQLHSLQLCYRTRSLCWTQLSYYGRRYSSKRINYRSQQCSSSW